MKTHAAIVLFFSALLLTSSFAFAQAQPPAQTPSASPDNADTQILGQVRSAAAIAANTQKQDFDGYLAVHVDQEKWAQLAKSDADLGPFLKLEEPKAGKTMVLIAPAASPTGTRVAVFFENGKPVRFAVSPNRTDAGAVKPVPKDALAGDKNKFDFTKADVASDDGEPLEAYGIKAAQK